jgi:hypothetical protein
MAMKSIETIYNGHRFRSRLEARWAVFFDTARVRYEYEVESFDLNGSFYLPDFWLPEKNCWAEIKGADQAYMPEEQEISQDMMKCMLLAQQSRKPVLWLCGQIPNLSLNLKRHGFPVEKDKLYCLQLQGVSWYEVTPQFNFYGNATNDQLDGLEVCWPDSKYSWLYDEASLLKARQARFEHGESG